jgi:hypothetical protein
MNYSNTNSINSFHVSKSICATIYMRSFAFMCFVMFAHVCTGCSDFINANPDIPFDEKIVIQAYLQAGQPLDKIMLSMTKPVLQAGDTRPVYINDAEVFISVGGQTYRATSYTRVDTMLYDKGGSFAVTIGNAYRVPITVQPGATYRIEVRRQGLVATATTVVPFPPTMQSPVLTAFRSSSVSEIQFRFTAQVQYQPATATRFYGTLVRRRDSLVLFNGAQQNVKSEQPFILTRSTDNSSMQTAEQIISSGGWIAMTPRSDMRITFVAQAIDEPFYSYYLSLDRSQDKDFEPFAIGSGSNTLWNVKGDGIGLWIGMATREIEIP